MIVLGIVVWCVMGMIGLYDDWKRIYEPVTIGRLITYFMFGPLIFFTIAYVHFPKMIKKFFNYEIIKGKK